MIQEQLPDFHHLGYTLVAAPALESCDAHDEVALTEHSTDRVHIHATLGCQGMVVLSDVFFPGWHADVDGNRALIFEVNEAMRGVVVPRGDHIITMRYRPTSALAGGLLSLIGVAGAVAVTAHRRPITLRASLRGGAV